VFEHYRELRSLAPVFRSDSYHASVATSYEAVSAAFRHPTAVVGPFAAESFKAGAEGPWYDMCCRMMLFLDPAEHLRIRQLVSRMFTRRAVERLRPVSQEVVDRLLDQVTDRHEMELISDFAYELPIAVVSGLCGFSPEDVGIVLTFAHDFAARWNPNDTSEATIRGGDDSARGLTRYFEDALASRRQSPGDDMLTALVEGEPGEFQEEELIANAVLLFMAGHETTANLIANGLYALLQHPDQLDLLRRDPELLKGAVEELLRFDPPLHVSWRVFPDGAEIAGQWIPPNERLMLLLASANHDPSYFSEPDRLDIVRSPSEHTHLSFAWGPYYCLGASLARVQTQVAIWSLLTRFPDLHLVEQPRWNPTLFGRGPVALKLAW
jgi:cytochrome P450